METGSVARGAAGASPWRERILRALLSTLAVLGGIAYLPSVWLGVREGLPGIVLLDTGAYGLVLGLYFARRLPYRVRASALLGMTYVLGLALLARLGPFGAGPVWILAVPPVAAILFNLRITVVATAITALTLLALGWARVLVGSWTPDAMPGGLLVVIAANALVVDALIAVSIAVLVRGIEQEVHAREEANRELSRERNLLEQANRDLRQSAEERERVEQRLRHSERLTALGTLAGGIAHDFNNLLTPIITSLELLRDDETDPERGALMDSAAEAGNRGRDLVARILAFSRPSTDDRRPLDAAAGVAEACRLLRASIPGSVVVQESLDPRAGSVLLTPTELQQVILNTGSNALHAMRPTGGTLSIRVTAADPADLPEHLQPAAERYVRLDVTDTGAGMDAETLRRATEPFFTTRGPGEGTGLGLASVHGIVTSAGGALEIRSTEGQGTTVTVVLPHVGEPAVRDEPARTLRRGNGQHILLVDDEAPIRSVGVRFLERAGYRVTSAEDGAAALARLRAAAGDVALVLTDNSMPGISGIDLAREILSRWPDLPVVLVSGLVDDELRLLAESAGCTAVVSKPFQLGPLTELLHGTLAVSGG